ncbi:MAG: hypothetical protein R3Y64_09310 [Peptostreptococcaceae bacterium]
MNSINLYKKLISNNKSKDILLLVENSMIKNKYIDNLDLDCSEKLDITTYYNFIKKEIKVYFPLIDFELLGKEEPKFINSLFVDEFILKKVNSLRIEKGYFNELRSSDRSISKQILNNIRKSCENLIDYKEVSSLIYNKKDYKDKISEEPFKEMNEIIIDYFETFLRKSILDDSLSIFIYNNYLLNNKDYLNRLKNKTIIIDSLEKLNFAQIDFIEKLKGIGCSIHCFYDLNKDYSSFNNFDKKYVEEVLLNKEHINIYKNHNIDFINTSDIYSFSEKIEDCYQEIFFDQMLDRVISEIQVLKDKRYKNNDIGIICPINTNLIEQNLKNKNIYNNTLFFNNKIIDTLSCNKFINATITALCIYYNFDKKEIDNNKIIDKTFYSKFYYPFIEVLFDTNKINAKKMFDERNISVKTIFNDIRSLQALSPEEFIYKFYEKYLINKKYGRKNLQLCVKIATAFEDLIDTTNIIFDDKDDLYK